MPCHLLLLLSILTAQIPHPIPNLGLGPEVLVSHNEDGGILRCEPAVAMRGDRVVAAWNDSSGGRLGAKTGVRVAWSWSKDAGKSFTFGGYLPETAAGVAPSAADSWLVADREGDFFLTIIAFDEKTATDEIQCCAMEAGEPGKWKRRANVRMLKRSGQDSYLDKPALAIGSDGALGCVYTHGRKIECAFSHDKGRSWGSPVVVSTASARSRLGSHLVVDGESVVAAWMEGGGTTLNEVWYARSADGGSTFAPAERLHTIKNLLITLPGLKIGLGVPFLVPGNVWMSSFSGGKPSATVLAIHEATTTGSRILVLQVPNSGPVKAEPVELASADPAKFRFYPTLASTTAGVIAAYYDRRDATSATLTDVYCTYMTPDLKQASIRLTTASTDWDKTAGDKEFAPIQRVFGDYITVCADGDRAFAVWTDGRSGAPRIMGRLITIR